MTSHLDSAKLFAAVPIAALSVALHKTCNKYPSAFLFCALLFLLRKQNFPLKWNGFSTGSLPIEFTPTSAVDQISECDFFSSNGSKFAVEWD